MSGWTVALSGGRYGGFYFTHGRVCLGWVALTWLCMEIDDLMHIADKKITEAVCADCPWALLEPVSDAGGER